MVDLLGITADSGSVTEGIEQQPDYFDAAMDAAMGLLSQDPIFDPHREFRAELRSVLREERDAVVDPNGVYRPEDLVRLLNVGRTSVYSWMREGLRYADVAGGRRILGSDVLAFIRNRRS